MRCEKCQSLMVAGEDQTEDGWWRGWKCMGCGRRQEFVAFVPVAAGAHSPLRRQRGVEQATHCYQGHPLIPQNVKVRHDGARICLVCKAMRGNRASVSAHRNRKKHGLTAMGSRRELGES
jgi:DNA-directed RNA polymerase subunit M/transcription elongation factor TFIIS